MPHESDRLRGERTLTVVDVGASIGGVVELPGLEVFTNLYGFEANPEEYRKLIANRDGSVTEFGSPARNTVAASFRKLKSAVYRNWAISDGDGVATLSIARKDGCTSLSVPSAQAYVYSDPSFGTLGGRMEMAERTQVECHGLFTAASALRIPYADYLKIDVESLSYEVLWGARAFLDHVGVIKAEVEFVPLREGQQLFSDVDGFLRGNDFELINLEDCRYGFHGASKGKGQLLLADALYLNRAHPRESQAMILEAKGYTDLAQSLQRAVK